MPSALIHQSKTCPVLMLPQPQAISSVTFFAFGVYVLYIFIFLHTLMYKKIHVLIFPRSCFPSRSEMGFLGLGQMCGASPVKGTHHRSS
jgi:hypothetical protein